MAKIQKKIFRDGYGGTVEFSNIVSSSVTNPHSTMISIRTKEKTNNFYVARYIDLDSIGPFELESRVYAYLDSIKEEMKLTPAEAQMYRNNKNFKSIVKEELVKIEKQLNKELIQAAKDDDVISCYEIAKRINDVRESIEKKEK